MRRTTSDSSCAGWAALIVRAVGQGHPCRGRGAAITTAVSACLLRAIEKEMPQIEPLPAGKMVVLACPDTVEVPPAPTTEVVRATEVALAPPTEADRVAMGEGNSTTDVKTEQNV